MRQPPRNFFAELCDLHVSFLVRLVVVGFSHRAHDWAPSQLLCAIGTGEQFSLAIDARERAAMEVRQRMHEPTQMRTEQTDVRKRTFV